jgi:hypothetical protein
LLSRDRLWRRSERNSLKRQEKRREWLKGLKKLSKLKEPEISRGEQAKSSQVSLIS